MLVKTKEALVWGTLLISSFFIGLMTPNAIYDWTDNDETAKEIHSFLITPKFFGLAFGHIGAMASIASFFYFNYFIKTDKV